MGWAEQLSAFMFVDVEVTFRAQSVDPLALKSNVSGRSQIAVYKLSGNISSPDDFFL